MATEQGTNGFDDEQLPILDHGSEIVNSLGQSERSTEAISTPGHDNQTGTRPLEEEGLYPHSFSVAKNAENYNMSHPERGKAVIFNFNTFEGEEMEREGSEKDLKDLGKCLAGMEFTVVEHNNLKYDEYTKVIKGLKAEDHRQRDCLVLVIMTHGYANWIVFSDGVSMKVHKIWTDFHADECPTLAGKPKIFIIQACRGETLDNGTTLQHITASHSQGSSQTDFASFSYTIPNAADIFVAFSSPVDHISWRCPENGSWFIQAICEVFNLFKFTLDLQQLFTRVNRKVALDYKTINQDNEKFNKKVQVPCISHTLIRNVIFKEKFVQESGPSQDGLRHEIEEKTPVSS